MNRAQVFIRAKESRPFYFALNHNRRRRGHINMACENEGSIVTRIAQEFRRLYPSSATCDRLTSRKQHAEFYAKHCHAIVCKDMQDSVGGFVVLSGELLGLHNVRHGTGDWMMRYAVELGADRLDTFDIPHLLALYQRHGFKEVLREANTTPGMPDIVFMRRDNHA